MEPTRQLVILAGGQGTRLRSVLGDRPKPMAEIGGMPVLEHQVRSASCYGFSQVLFLTSYRSEIIEEYFGDGQRWGIDFRYVLDADPLGTAGATLAAMEHLQERFVILYGDVMHDIDLRRFCDFHESRAADATIFVHPNDHPQDSDLVEFDAEKRVTAFHGYPHPPGANYRNMVNAGLYLLEKSALEPFAAKREKLDFGKDLFPAMIASGRNLAAYPSREYIKDMGTPARLEKVGKDYASGRIAALNLEKPVPAVFIDRDGTLIRHLPFLSRPEQVELEPGACEGLKLLNGSRFLSVLVTNQPVIARGECSPEELEEIHGRMETLLAVGDKAHLDAIYYCPHHPDGGYPGEVAALKIPCDCRKPGPGMFLQAAEEHHIDLAASWMIGDTTSDLQAARLLGMKSVLVLTGEAGRDGKYAASPTATAADFSAACALVLAAPLPA